MGLSLRTIGNAMLMNCITCTRLTMDFHTLQLASHFGSQSVTFSHVSAPRWTWQHQSWYVSSIPISLSLSIWHSSYLFDQGRCTTDTPWLHVTKFLHRFWTPCATIKVHIYWVTTDTFGVVPSTEWAHFIQLKYTHILHFFPNSNGMPSRTNAVEWRNSAIYLVAFSATMRFNSGMLSTVLWKAMKHGHGWDQEEITFTYLYHICLP